MGHNKLLHRPVSEQFGYRGIPVYGISDTYLISVLKRVNKMAEIKSLVWLFNWLGYSISGYTIFVTFATWKADVLFVFSALFILVRIYFRVRKGLQEIKMTDLEIKDKENDVNNHIKDSE
jgi:hypothetical protein